MTITHAMLAAAAVRALRNWLGERGHPEAVIAAPDGRSEVYHLPGVGRLVQVRAAIGPMHPLPLSGAEIRTLRALAGRLDASAWEAHVITRSNYHPSAILWRGLELAAQRAARLAAG